MIPFKTQYEKLVKAYMNNEVVPNSACACFIGNLLNGNTSWVNFKDSILFQVPKEDLDFAINALNIESGVLIPPVRFFTLRAILCEYGVGMAEMKRLCLKPSNMPLSS